MKVLLIGQDDSLPGGMPVYIRSLRDYLTRETDIPFRYLNETAAKGRSDMDRPGGPALALQALRLRGTLVRTIREFRPDLAHLHVAHGLSILEKGYLAKVCLSSGVPAAIHMHGAGLVENVGAMPPFIRKFVEGAFRPPHRVIALSPSIASELQTTFPSWDVTVIPNAVDLPESQSELPAKFTVGFLGYMDGRKGEQDLIEALALTKPFVRAVLAGDGPNAESAQQRARDLGLTERVSFVGRVGGESKDAFLRSLSALCLPSYAENYPIALLEAMSYGKPVIASAVGGVPDLVTPGQNGWLFEPGDIKALSVALDAAAADRRRLGVLAAAALDTVRSRHIWAVTGPILVRLYQRTAEKLGK